MSKDQPLHILQSPWNLFANQLDSYWTVSKLSPRKWGLFGLNIRSVITIDMHYLMMILSLVKVYFQGGTCNIAILSHHQKLRPSYLFMFPLLLCVQRLAGRDSSEAKRSACNFLSVHLFSASLYFWYTIKSHFIALCCAFDICLIQMGNSIGNFFLLNLKKKQLLVFT